MTTDSSPGTPAYQLPDDDPQGEPVTEVEAEWRMVNMDEWRAEQAANLARMVALKDELLQAENGRIAAQIEREEASKEQAKTRREEADRLYVRVAALNRAAALVRGTDPATLRHMFRLADRFADWLQNTASQPPDSNDPKGG